MAERWGIGRPDEIEKEPPKEAPIHVPGDATGVTDQPGDDTTPPETGEDLGAMEENMDEGKYTEVIQDGYGRATRDLLTGELYDVEQKDALEKEGAHIMAETEAIEKYPAKMEGEEEYLEDLDQQPSESLDTPSGVVDDTPSDIGEDIGSDIGSYTDSLDQEP